MHIEKTNPYNIKIEREERKRTHEKKKSKKEVLHQAQGSHAKAESDLENRLSDKAINRETGIKYRVDKFGDQNYSTSKLKKDIASVSLQTYVQLGNSEIQEYERILHEQEKALVTFKSELTLSFDSLLLNSKELLTRQIGTSNKIKEFPFLYQKRFRIHEIFSQHLNSLYLHVISLL